MNLWENYGKKPFVRHLMIAQLQHVLRKLHRLGEIGACMRCSSQWPRLIPAYLFRKRLPYPYRFQTRDQGRLLLHDWDDLTTAWHRFFGPQFSLPDDSRTILDLGANIGAFSLWAALRYPSARIFALEPWPETYQKLCGTIAANSLIERIVPMELAVTDCEGQVLFDAAPNRRSYARRVVSAKSKIQTTQKVASCTLESLLAQLSLEEVDCVKMDIEGGEYAVFRSTSIPVLRRVRFLTMEYHEARMADELWRKLEDAGFRRVQKLVLNGWCGIASYARVD